MKKSIFDSKTSKELIGLSPVLSQWIKYVEHFSEVRKDDACYWYNERASLSVLAAAAWAANSWIGFEEFSTQKRGDTRDKKSGKVKNFKGRCDLLLCSPNQNNIAEYAVEAKQTWQSIGNSDDYRYGALKKTQKQAWKDAGELDSEEAAHRLALTICVPFISQRTAADATVQAEDLIKGWMKGLINRSVVPWDAIAWCFPGRTRKLGFDDYGTISPGVVLIFRKLRRNSRIARNSQR